MLRVGSLVLLLRRIHRDSFRKDIHDTNNSPMLERMHPQARDGGTIDDNRRRITGS
jgi:hypothetical protein